MINVKKNCWGISSILFLILICFFIGFQAGKAKGPGSMESGIVKGENFLKNTSTRNREITKELKKTKPKINIIESGNRELEEENIKVNKSLRNIEGGISGDINIISGIIKGIDSYIQEPGETEEDNNHSISS